MKALLTLVVVILNLFGAVAQQGKIIAGTGIDAAFNGDGISATKANIYPMGLWIDKSDNIFLADFLQYRFQVIDNNGIINTIGGNGTMAIKGGSNVYFPDVAVYSPYFVTGNNEGVLYVCDQIFIWRVDIATKVASVYAGANGSPGYSGDGGVASKASLSHPQGIWYSSSTKILYIADTVNQCIRVVDTTTNIINTYAGKCQNAGYEGDGGLATEAKFFNPSAIWGDSDENIFVVDSQNAIVRKIDGKTRIITTFAGIPNQPGNSGNTGPATSAKLQNGGLGLVGDNKGNLYIADTLNYSVRKVDSKGIITTVIYEGFSGGTWNVDSLAMDSKGNLFYSTYKYIKEYAMP